MHSLHYKFHPRNLNSFIIYISKLLFKFYKTNYIFNYEYQYFVFPYEYTGISSSYKICKHQLTHIFISKNKVGCVSDFAQVIKADVLD